MNPRITVIGVVAVLWALCELSADAQDLWITYDGYDGPGKGKHIVFVTGDDEYRSEESMPQMAKILARHHGFKCTVLFAIDKETGKIAPDTLDNIPGLDALRQADLMILFLRFRELPDDQMKLIMEYTNSGKPIMGIRTSTHAFNYGSRNDSPYTKYSWTSKEPKGGYGRAVLGETWVNHYGHHKVESTRGVIPWDMDTHPIVKGCEDIWCPSDVYGIRSLSGDSHPVILGQVLRGMTPDSPPNYQKRLVPVAWIKSHTGASGKKARVFTTTMGHSYDFKSEGLRRLFVNAAYWCMEMEDKIPPRATVEFVGAYDPSDIGFGTHKKGLRPRDYAMKPLR